MRDFALLCIGVAALVASFRKLTVHVHVVEQAKTLTVHTNPVGVGAHRQFATPVPRYNEQGKFTGWVFPEDKG